MTAVQQSVQKSGDIADALLSHYQRSARILPWRAPPGTSLPDPYHVWLSEIMLQQTTVAAVAPYFLRFTERWPSFAALAAADQADVMAEWAGLGYYARARNLVACARVIVLEHGGHMPSTEAQLLGLPGIGPYTAAAIAAIAFGKRAVVVDANIERVTARLFGIDTPLPAAKSKIRAATESITPMENVGDFAQAMMDLGAGLCAARKPNCEPCPILGYCAAGQTGTAELYPVKPPKKVKPQRTGNAYWVQKGDSVWLVTRKGKGMLAGMRALPDDGWSAQKDGNAIAPFHAEWRSIPLTVVHSFTHFTLLLNVAVTASPPKDVNLGEGIYWPLNSLDKAGLPTLFSKAVKAVLAVGEK
ncbi:MAG: A/G-specific adenine glycosylase [Sphingorhabdus sp.]